VIDALVLPSLLTFLTGSLKSQELEVISHLVAENRLLRRRCSRRSLLIRQTYIVRAATRASATRLRLFRRPPEAHVTRDGTL